MHVTRDESARHGVTVIAVTGAGDPGSGSTLRDAILGSLVEKDARVVVDLSSLDGLDSGMLAGIMAAASTAGSSTIAIVCPGTHQARAMFAMTGIDTVLPVCETRPDAFRALAAD